MPKKELAKGYTTGTCATGCNEGSNAMLLQVKKCSRCTVELRRRKLQLDNHGYTEKIYRQGIAGYGILCGQKKQRR